MTEEEQVQQAQQPPAIDQLILGLMWELQMLRASVHELTGVVHGLTNTLKEDEE